MLKVDFQISTISIYTSKSVSLWPIAIPNCCKKHSIRCLFGQIFQNAPNFSNGARWVWNGNPPIDIPKMTKKQHEIFQHPRIPSTSESPPWLNIVYCKSTIIYIHCLKNTSSNLCTLEQDCRHINYSINTHIHCKSDVRRKHLQFVRPRVFFPHECDVLHGILCCSQSTWYFMAITCFLLLNYRPLFCRLLWFAFGNC